MSGDDSITSVMASEPPEGPSVLLVDDNPDNLELLGNLLRAAGHRVRAVGDGPRALRAVGARPTELILLDLQMPGMDGYEVLARLKADPATREIPVIVISALDDVHDKVRAFEAGAVDYVTKPFQAPEVLSRVGSHLQLHRMRGELLKKQLELEARHGELQRQHQALLQERQTTSRVFSALAAALPGTVLDGKYRLESKIGSGGFASVYNATHLALKRPVAIKVFQPWPGNERPEALERFRREGVAACRVQHENAVQVLDSGISESGIAYLVLELLEGRTLGQAMRDAGPQPASRCAQVLAPVCEALAAAHALGIVHRDVKPDNIFLHATAGGEVVKVLDFGIAKLISSLDADSLGGPLTRGFVGTPLYMAPERVIGSDFDGRSDVYSVGVILYAMLAGRLPFVAQKGEAALSVAMKHVKEPPPALSVPGLSAGVAGLVMQTLAKEPAKRPTAHELARFLRALTPA